jgi:hypothetical protein
VGENTGVLMGVHVDFSGMDARVGERVGFSAMGEEVGVGVGAGALTLFWVFSLENFFKSSSEGRGMGVSISEGGITSETSVGMTGIGGAGSAQAKGIIPHKLMIGIRPRARFISEYPPSSFFKSIGFDDSKLYRDLIDYSLLWKNRGLLK